MCHKPSRRVKVVQETTQGFNMAENKGVHIVFSWEDGAMWQESPYSPVCLQITDVGIKSQI